MSLWSRRIVIHYTLNTGVTVPSPRSEVGPEVLAALRSLRHGGSIPGVPPFRATVTHGQGCAIFTIWRGQESLCTSAVAWTEDGKVEAWRVMEDLYHWISNKHPGLMTAGATLTMPGTLPWLSVVLLPSTLKQRRGDVEWLGGFERCFAWMILEDRQSR